MTEQEKESVDTLKEHQIVKALVSPFKVIVSPFKGFREIVQTPSIIGMLLIIALFVLVSAGAEYSNASKIILDSPAQSISLLDSNLFGGYIISYLLQSTTNLFLSWIICAGALLLLAKLLGETGGSVNIQGRHFFIVVGHAFVILVVYVLVNLLLISSLPQIHFDFDTWVSGTPEAVELIRSRFVEVWGQTLAVQALNYLSLVFQFWLIGLITIAVHFTKEIKWTRAILLGATAYFTSTFLASLLTAFVA